MFIQKTNIIFANNIICAYEKINNFFFFVVIDGQSLFFATIGQLVGEI
jgi:hypothetical protein